jgi:hypothetical protein
VNSIGYDTRVGVGGCGLGMHQFQLTGSPSDTGSIEFAESRLIILTRSQSGSRIPSGTGGYPVPLGIFKLDWVLAK